MNGPAHNLNPREQVVALDFLLYHLSMDLRGRLMAELPTIYAKAFPTVEPALLAARVTERIEADRAGEPVH